MKDYIEFLLTPLLSIPDQLKVELSPSVVSIKVAQEDMGRVIGKQGGTISAIRTLVRTFCSLQNLPPVSLNLVEAQTDQ